MIIDKSSSDNSVGMWKISNTIEVIDVMDKVSHFIIFEKTGDMINVNLLDNHFTMTFFYFIIKNDI